MAEKTPRHSIEWDLIEIEWRAGIKSKKQISTEFGVSRAAMDKRFAKLGVERDLGGKIQAKAEALVTRSLVAAQVTPMGGVTEQAVIEVNAQAIATIRLSHRQDIAKSRTLAMKLLDELECTTDGISLYEQLGDLLYAPDEKGIDKLNELYRKVIALPTRTKTMKDLADTLKTLVGLEREAYGIAEAQKIELTGKDGGPIETKSLTMAERATRLAAVLAAKQTEVDGNT